MKYLYLILWFPYSDKQKRELLANAMLDQIDGDYFLTECIELYFAVMERLSFAAMLITLNK